ncbi:glucan ABC transporter ATP-binding protein/ permease [Elioraea sp. Yellowstone]|jgi:ATP-binding cassette subfamily B protein|uniref:glucan ABC transporter ATP-binding protein/ permease n=1 Tax=Elioraea sp. Yellowstone TaxID=2592070 RepID=UPI001150E919|nr:glucan ABC transporter ATP-binding protein/ permease [Elioraea sp. Yellowstone]TQF80810.1 glucan ABC transporter ATP-binding protein/ permease [Elioraea sp. Yellowstone]
MSFTGLYARVLGLLAPERATAIALAVANVLLAGLTFLEPVLFGRVVDMLATGATRPAEEVWSGTVTLLAIWAAVGLSGIVAAILVALHADRLAHRNRLAAMHRFFEHVLRLPLSFHGDTHSGRLLKIMLGGADNMFWVWLGFFREHLATFVIALVLLPLTLLMNWRLAALLIVLAALFAVAAAAVIRRTQEAQREVEGHHATLAGTAGDALANVMVVQSFVRLSAEAQQFRDTMRRLLAAQFPVLTWWALLTVLTRAASTLTVIAIFVLGTWLTLAGRASVGEIVTFMGFATLLIARLEQAVGFVSTLFMQMPAVALYFEVMDTRSTVPEKPDAVVFGRVRGEVAFEHVTFGYPGGPPVLRDVSFTAAPGRTVALVGQTGAGKSTAMALLQRLWDPQAGRITVDGVDIRDVTLASLRAQIGVVFQESLLFNRSIADNLRVGKPDATQEELEAACRLAEAHDFILRQPKGYETLVGERGATLSGGQRQRLAIARALLKDPPILILDEATSALDAATEARVQRALRALMRGRTTFVIAHRLSTVRDADEILVFAEGRIAEQGRFDDLVARGGIFADLVATQLAPAAD